MATAKSGTTRAAKSSRNTKSGKPSTSTKKAAPAIKKSVAKGAVSKKSVSKKSVATKASAKKAVPKKAVTKKAVTKKSTGKTVLAATAVGRVPVRKAATKSAMQEAKTLPLNIGASKQAAAKSPVKPVNTGTLKTKVNASPRSQNAVPIKSSPAKSALDTGSNQATKPAARATPPAQSGKTSGKPRKITPEQALANTRALLEAKKEHDRQPQAWQKLDQHAGPVDHAGYQSPEAADKAEQLHEGESRMQAIQGSISSTDRQNQGKRDGR